MAANKLTILAIATEWNSKLGGLSTLNRELCTVLAQFEDVRVLCGVPVLSPGEVESALVAGVMLVAPTEQPDEDPSAAIRRPFVGITGSVDVVIGHGRVTGEAGLVQANEHHRGASYIHFLHMDARAIDWHKDDAPGRDPAVIANQRAEMEIQLALSAQLIVAVGPELHARYSNYLQGDGRTVLEFLPGLTPSSHQPTPPLSPSCLLFGRGEDASLKGLRFAAKAMAALNRFPGHERTRLTILGAQPGTSAALHADLQRSAGTLLKLNIENYTFDRAVVLGRIRSTSLVLMPSLEEGFGLTGLEAISEGTPVLLSASSGLAIALRSHVPRQASHHIIDVRDGEENAARRMQSILDDPHLAFDRIEALRSAMRDIFSWKRSAQALLEQLRALAPAAARPEPGSDNAQTPRPPLAERMRDYLQRASQGLLSWRQTLTKSNTWIERAELSRLMEHAKDPTRPPLILLGAPGSGKSALLGRLTMKLMEQGTAVLAIKADLLPAEISSDESLEGYLGLPTTVVDALEAVVDLKPTVLVIDQLDALADLVDLKSERLNVLLALIKKVSALGRVPIVLSCRSFESEHDARLRALNCERLEVKPLPEEGVARVLTEQVPTVQQTPRLLELLGLPHSLELYLNLPESSRSGAALESHQGLVRARWAHCIDVAGVGMEEVSQQIATLIDEREESWLSLDFLQQRQLGEAVRSLLACGLLTLANRRGTEYVAFSHQTLFEFARAREFLSSAVLPRFVRARQHGLFVRPVLWMTLPYLRSADFSSYLQQLRDLWEDGALRRHVHALLLGFVGQLPDPKVQEIELFAQRLEDPRWQGEALRSVIRQQVWFEILCESSLPGLLSGQHQGLLISLLTAATAFAPDKVAELMSRYWLPQVERLSSIVRVLQLAEQWNPALVSFVEKIVCSEAMEFGLVEDLVLKASAVAPDIAPGMVVAELERQLNAIIEVASQRIEGKSPANEICELVDRRGGFSEYYLREIVEADPRRFVEVVFPWFARASVSAARRWNEGWYPDAGFQSYDTPGTAGLALIMRDAFCEVAEADGDVYEALVEQWKACEARPVHNVLVLALHRALPRSASLALDYLLGDPRRLILGGLVIDDGCVHEDPSMYSRKLIADLGRHLDAAARARLEGALKVSQLCPTAGASGQLLRWNAQSNRKHRLGLLQALGIDNVSTATKDEMIVDARIFRTPSPTRGGNLSPVVLTSPMSAEQMLLAGDEEIVTLFSELAGVDESGLRNGMSLWDIHARASHAFSEAARQKPKRFARLLFRLAPGTRADPVVMALETMGRGLPIEELEALVHELGEMGKLASVRRRGAAAWALQHSLMESRKVQQQASLRQETVALMEAWLAQEPEDVQPHAVHTKRRNLENSSTSLVFGHDGSAGELPTGNWQILDSLTFAYLAMPDPQLDSWMRVLEAHVVRSEDPAVWLALISDLRPVLRSSPERASRFLSSLFARYPVVLQTTPGLQLLAQAMHRLPLTTVQQWMEDLCEEGWALGEQAFGELLVLLATRRNTIPWALETLERSLTGWSAAPDAGSLRIIGVSHVAAILWHEPMWRESATSLLLRLVPHASGRIAEALMRTFMLGELLWDEHAQQLLTALSGVPQVLCCAGYWDLIPELSKYTATSPSLVARVATSLVGELLGRRRSVVPDVGQALNDIAVTLQRLGATHREVGLTLFEQLLELDVDAARQTLVALDRTRSVGSAVVSRRIRPPRSARRPRMLS